MSNYDDFIGHIQIDRQEQALTYLTKGADGAYVYPDVIDNIANYDNSALRGACRNGHIDFVVAI